MYLVLLAIPCWTPTLNPEGATVDHGEFAQGNEVEWLSTTYWTVAGGPQRADEYHGSTSTAAA